MNNIDIKLNLKKYINLRILYFFLIDINFFKEEKII
jgi:hypothetical protein